MVSYRNNIKRPIVVGFILILTGLFWFGKSMAQTISHDLTITSPHDGVTVVPGQTINIEVTVVPSASFKGVGIVIEDIGFGPFGMSNSPPYSLSLTIPNDLIGKKKITAFGMTGPGVGVFSVPITIDIESLATPTSLSVNPTGMGFDFIGGQLKLSVTGNFSDGSSLDITHSSKITFKSEDTGTAMVDGIGMVTATGSGSTRIIISYDNISIGLPISVASAIRGDLDGDGDVDKDDVNIVMAWINRPATSGSDARDMNKDGKIDALDARVLTTLCTFPRCATHQ